MEKEKFCIIAYQWLGNIFGKKLVFLTKNNEKPKSFKKAKFSVILKKPKLLQKLRFKYKLKIKNQPRINKTSTWNDY